MSKITKEKKKEKRVRVPSEYSEGSLHFKTGPGWKACHDGERDLYTAETFWAGCYDLYEINEGVFNELKTKGMKRRDAQSLIITGRHLYKSVSDRCGSYDIALDEDYAKLCPWAEVQKTGELWDRELTDLAVSVFDSEKQNREQRQDKLFHMIVEQTKEYPMRMIYDPETGEFAASDRESLAHARNFGKPYGWIKESGTPPEPHWDCILMTDRDFALGDEVEVKIIGVFKRADFDHKYIVAESERDIEDYADLSADEKEELCRLYPRIGEGEGWFGKEEAEYCMKNHRKAF